MKLILILLIISARFFKIVNHYALIYNIEKILFVFGFLTYVISLVIYFLYCILT